MAEIVRDDGIRSGDPRIEGSRITVLDVKRRVIDAGEDPHVVADEYDFATSLHLYARSHPTTAIVTNSRNANRRPMLRDATASGEPQAARSKRVGHNHWLSLG